MRTRYLPIFFGVVFALTLFFAVAAGAQEERTDTEGVGVQVVEAAESNRVKVTCLMHTTAHIDFLRASGHEHHFAGGGKGTLTQDMTAEELGDSETSCATPSDTALAWFPVIQDPGDSVEGYEEVDRVNLYYSLESLHLMPAFGQIDLATHEGGDLSYGCGRNPTKLDAPPVGCTEGGWRVDADLPGTNVSVVIHYKNSDGVLGANPRVSTDAGFTDYRSMHVDYFATFTPEFVELVEACAQQMPNLADECRTTRQQAIELHQQQVPDDQQQQQVVEVQQQQAQNDQQQTIAVQQQVGVESDTNNRFKVEIKQGLRILKSSPTHKTNVRNRSFTVSEGSGEFKLETTVEDVKMYSLTVQDCRGQQAQDCRDPRTVLKIGSETDNVNEMFDIVGDKFRVTYSVTFEDDSNNNRHDGRGGGGGGGGGGNNPVGIAQENTTPDTTTDTNTANANTADAALDTTTADRAANADFANRPDSGSFRCDLFLRTVRDEGGALRDQYRGNEEIVQRFEQCLSDEVLADTIPDRNLPFTGGASLPSGGGLILLVTAMILAGRIIRR